MQNIQELLINSLNKKVENGELDALVDKTTENFLYGILTDITRSYSDLSKAVKEKMEKNLLARIDEISLEQYNDIVLQKISRMIQDNYVTAAAEHLQKQLDDLFQKPKIKTLAELIAMFRKDNEDEARDDEVEEMTFEYDDKYDRLLWVYFDYLPNKSDHSCKYCLLFNRESKQLISVTVRDEPRYGSDKIKEKPLTANFKGMDDFEKTLFQIQASAHPIELDTKRVFTSYEWNNH